MFSENIPSVAPTNCTLCPRACGADRANNAKGYCGCGKTLTVARAALHHWEEPCISGTHGSGTVFFSGCTLKCCYCQNYTISAEGFGKEITPNRLAEIFLSLQAQGAHNINLVTPGQWQPWITPALTLAKQQGLHLPVICNTSGYETATQIDAWNGFVDIWLVDFKYADATLAKELSCAENYPIVAKEAIEQMLTQTGKLQFDTQDILQKGTIIRHLALPNHTDDSFAVLNQLAQWQQVYPQHFLPSLMSQYTPFYKAAAHGIGRRITSYEYNKVITHALSKGLSNGYMQEKSSAKEEYTPLFDGTGI
ncbi:MAG: 4Fe-4S cluster-binding domain-containing protein [Faecalibacterium sp.]